MTSQAPIKADLVLEKAEQELELQIAGMEKIEDGLKQAGLDAVKEWEAASWWTKHWRWEDTVEQWIQTAKANYEYKHGKEHRQRKSSARCCEGLIQLAKQTQGDVMLSAADANFLNISDER